MEEGENCELVIQLPDGSQHSHSFKLGATVAYVKLQVQQLYGVPMEKQHMQTGGKTLIDPCKHSSWLAFAAAAAHILLVLKIQAAAGNLVLCVGLHRTDASTPQSCVGMPVKTTPSSRCPTVHLLLRQNAATVITVLSCLPPCSVPG